MLAFTFPGQGSQRPGMGRPWIDHPSWEVVGDASEAAGRDIAGLLLEADTDELTATRNAQLATFALSLVALDAIERLGLAPSACAGHSLGEYTALVATGALGFEDGARLVTERGDAMQGAADEHPGTMAAFIGINDADAEAACQRAESDVWLANYNSPGQVVVAGTAEGVAAAAEVARTLGARRVLPIQVGGAFHTPLMAAARHRLRKALATASFADPEIPVSANVDARPHVTAEEWPGLLSAQLCSPVRWHQTLSGLADSGVTAFVEVGPGGVLSALARRTVSDSLAVSVSKPDDLDVLVDALAGEGPLHTYAADHQGEHLYTSERLVVSQAAGLFQPRQDLEDRVAVGEVVGTVGTEEVRSPFSGSLQGFLANAGQRVLIGQPVAWLRAAPAQ
ncbi:MAG TPA: ACP S-malonyltransferase [Solirubrobacteraceae bacterium]